MDGHLAIGIARHIVPCQHSIKPPTHSRARCRLGLAVGGFFLVVGAGLGQVGNLAESEETLPQSLGCKLYGPLNAVVGQSTVKRRAAVTLGLGRLYKCLLPLAVTEARVAVGGERVDEVVEALFPSSLGRPGVRLVV